MDREKAKEYIKRKGHWEETMTKEEADKTNEEKIERVMKKGKIYGDPMVILNE